MKRNRTAIALLVAAALAAIPRPAGAQDEGNNPQNPAATNVALSAAQPIAAVGETVTQPSSGESAVGEDLCAVFSAAQFCGKLLIRTVQPDLVNLTAAGDFHSEPVRVNGVVTALNLHLIPVNYGSIGAAYDPPPRITGNIAVIPHRYQPAAGNSGLLQKFAGC